MKVLTIKQPWATLIVEGLKKYEFRTWKTNYRGKILIHAGQGIDKEALKKYEHLNLEYPTKRIIGEVTIEDCIKLDKETNKKISSENKLIYGDKDREGYAWKLSDARKIKSDKEVNGKLSLWNIKDTNY